MVALQPRRVQSDSHFEAIPARTQVLLIEGLAEVRETLKELLEALDYQVTAVSDATEAWQVPAPPDVIIADLSLEEPSAFGSIRELRGRRGWERVPATALIPCDGPEHRHRVAAAGFQESLVKPVSLWMLHRTLQMLAGV
jgi:CheY-like chemotaxis protein